MSKPRSVDSLLTKLELMSVNSEIFVTKTNGYVADNISTVTKHFPGRRYKQTTVYTHEGPTYTSLKDFHKVICITRLA